MSYDYYLIKKDKKEYFDCKSICIPIFFFNNDNKYGEYDIKSFKINQNFNIFYKKFITKLYDILPDYLTLKQTKIIAEKIYNWIGKDKIVCTIDTSDLYDLAEKEYKCVDFI